MRIASRFTAKGALLVTVCWVAALAISGATETLLFLAPALLIAIPLLGGFYVGEELVAKLAAPQPKRRPRAAAVRARLLPAAPSTWRPRGARLVAFALAKRPPPAAALPLS